MGSHRVGIAVSIHQHFRNLVLDSKHLYFVIMFAEMCEATEHEFLEQGTAS
jgi:hypothetical protein